MGATGSPRHRAFFVACGLYLCSPVAAADENPLVAIDRIGTQLDRCQKLPDHQNTMAMDGCFGDAVTAADTILSTAYRTAVARLRPSPSAESAERKDDTTIAARLAASQRAWTAFRAAQCPLEASAMLGGSGEAGEEMSCEFKMARERIRFLVQWLDDAR